LWCRRGHRDGLLPETGLQLQRAGDVPFEFRRVVGDTKTDPHVGEIAEHAHNWLLRCLRQHEREVGGAADGISLSQNQSTSRVEAGQRQREATPGCGLKRRWPPRGGSSVPLAGQVASPRSSTATDLAMVAQHSFLEVYGRQPAQRQLAIRHAAKISVDRDPGARGAARSPGADSPGRVAGHVGVLTRRRAPCASRASARSPVAVAVTATPRSTGSGHS
jgi:hypothetical protein